MCAPGAAGRPAAERSPRRAGLWVGGVPGLGAALRLDPGGLWLLAAPSCHGGAAQLPAWAGGAAGARSCLEVGAAALSPGLCPAVRLSLRARTWPSICRSACPSLLPSVHPSSFPPNFSGFVLLSARRQGAAPLRAPRVGAFSAPGSSSPSPHPVAPQPRCVAPIAPPPLRRAPTPPRDRTPHPPPRTPTVASPLPPGGKGLTAPGW